MSGDFAASIERHARYALGCDWSDLSRNERFRAVALAVRNRLIERRLATEERDQRAEC